jgi:hypothetical protein
MSRNRTGTEEEGASGPSRVRRLFSVLATRLDPWAGRIIGPVIGLVGSWYGAAAGFLLGAMVDAARGSRRLRRYFHDPDARLPEEGVPGMAAVAALAFSPAWPGPQVKEERRTIILRVAHAAFGSGAGFSGDAPASAPAGLPGSMQGLFLERQMTHLVEAALVEEGLPFDSLSRDLAMRGGPAAQALLAAYAYALPASQSRDLEHGAEAAILAALADSGCPAGTIAEARSRAFPDYHDPWELLGVGPDAGLDELKRAWRKKSRRYHPDLAGDAGAESFRALKAAYEFLKAWVQP